MSATRSRGSQTASGEPLPTVGLMTTEAAPVPLMGVKVEAELRDFAVHQTITQRYRNTEPDPIEAVYVFPIDEGAAVCGFNAVIDGRLIVGKVMEREAAFDRYDEALARGHGAYLLDQERPDVFTASVGNLPPGSEVMIQIMTVALLGSEGEDLLYVLPTTVSPRYAPPQDRGGIGRPPAEALNPPVGWQVPYGLEVELHLHMPSAIQRLESPTHPMSFDLKGKQATIRLGEETTALDRDLVIRIGLESALQPRIHLERHPSGSHAAMLVFQPRMPAGEGATTGPEVVFLVDRSGSMDGPSIEGARTALQLFLRALPQGSRFNILGFGSTFHALFEGSRPYTPENLQAAFAYVERMGADMGGTEILPALKAALEGRAPESDARQIIVLTDGQVTNTEEVIDLAGRHSDSTRLFAIGLGAGASRHLVQGLARAGRGVAEFIAPGERIEPKVMRQVGRALAPAVVDLAVDWGGLEVEQAPYRVPPAFAGERLILFGFLPDPQAGKVVLSGRRGSGTFREELLVDLEACQDGVLVTSLTARAMIRDLEEG
ncbi:MAG: VWA domain-containing protein, partial [Chloroflexi bacterium]|nr:VWA domain-containing protein [Chloroflexota bacterium]